MSSFEEYGDKYQSVRMERHDGILQMTFHTEGASMKWDEVAHREFGYAFADVGSDHKTQVVIMTGTGDAFIARSGAPKPPWTTPPKGTDQNWTSTALWDKTYREGKRLLTNLLDIEAPIISAINGSARLHSEIPLLCDIVLAAEDTVLQDAGHFPQGLPPGDGVHIVYPLLMGMNRGRYFLLTGQELPALEAKQLGLVNEILPREKLLPRAWELAEQLARQPVLTLRYTRVAFTIQLKRLMQDMLGYGLAVEGLAAVDGQIANR